MKYINIYGVGTNQVHSTDTFDIQRPDGLGKWLFLVVKSHACFQLDGKNVVTRPNTAIFFKPETPQIYHGLRISDRDIVKKDQLSELPFGENYQDHWMEFDMEEDYIENMGIPIATPITGFDDKEVDALFSLLLSEFYFGGAKKDLYIELFMTAILEKISEAVSSNGKKQSAFHELQQQIHLHPEKNWNIEEAARNLNFSSSHFQNTYRNLFGISFGNDVIKSRTRLACQLLSETDYSITRISALCGYHSDNYFIRQFKQTMGVTPSKYRH